MTEAITGLVPPACSRTGYDDDLYTCVQEQVALLRAGGPKEIDLDDILDEWRSLGAAERRRHQQLLEGDPGLKPRRGRSLRRMYPIARNWAAAERPLDVSEYPYAWDDILERPFEVDQWARQPK